MLEQRLFCPLCLADAVGDERFVRTFATQIIKRPDAFQFRHRFKVCTGKWRIEERKVSEWKGAQ